MPFPVFSDIILVIYVKKAHNTFRGATAMVAPRIIVSRMRESENSPVKTLKEHQKSWNGVILHHIKILEWCIFVSYQ